jgi:hypothetical protein
LTPEVAGANMRVFKIGPDKKPALRVETLLSILRTSKFWPFHSTEPWAVTWDPQRPTFFCYGGFRLNFIYSTLVFLNNLIGIASAPLQD